jgi:transposase-like protein
MTNETREAIKAKFVGLYQTTAISMGRAARQVGVSRVTIWRWRADDVVFDRAVADSQQRQDDLRLALIEDTMFERIAKGRATAAETIFWLVNRSRGRWKHLATIQHSIEAQRPGSITLVEMLQAASNGDFGGGNRQLAQSSASDGDDHGDDLRERR